MPGSPGAPSDCFRLVAAGFPAGCCRGAVVVTASSVIYGVRCGWATAGMALAPGRLRRDLARLVMPGKHWLRNVAAARDARCTWQEEHDGDQEGGR